VLAGPVLPAARRLLGCTLTSGGVTVRLTEVEAYAGERDPGSHAFRGRTARTRVMFGPAGHAYVYFTYGMHWCINVVCGPDGEASAVLLRAGEVVAGLDDAVARRPNSRPRDLARGPARLTKALGITGADNGAQLLGIHALAGPAGLHLAAGRPVPARLIRRGPRVGVAGAGAARPWRFWVEGEPTVSAYRAAAPARSRPVLCADTPIGSARTHTEHDRPAAHLGQTAAVTSPELPDQQMRAYTALVAGAEQVLPAGGLAAKLRVAQEEGRPLRVKLGIDPSGTELTIGHAVVLRKMRQFQDHGHLAVLIVGDFTGMVGDPSGRSATRNLLSAEQTAANSASYFSQVMRILDPKRVEVRRNSEWLASLTMADVIRESAQLTVAGLLERDDFARRFAARQPISLVEFLYPLLQGYDSVAVRADVELGGTDQTYNLLVGRDLQKAHGQPQQVVLTVPLLEGLDGVQKMGKSLGNYVSITEPSAEQFGKLMSIPDFLVGRYATLATDLTPAEVAELDRSARAGGRPAGQAKRSMARAVVSLYHGPAAALTAEQRFDTVFAERAVPGDLPEYAIAAGDPVHVPDLLRSVGFAPSTSQARRLIDDGAVRLDGERLAAGTYDLPLGDLVGRVLAAGRRRMVRLTA